MTNEFRPIWPYTVAGHDWRTPLYDPDFEQVAKRMDQLYRTAPLTDDERGLLLKLYEGLQTIDKRWWRHPNPLINTTAKTPYPAAPWIDVIDGDKAEHDAGFSIRLDHFVRRLERKHFDATDDATVLLRDPDGDQQPGDDI